MDFLFWGKRFWEGRGEREICWGEGGGGRRDDLTVYSINVCGLFLSFEINGGGLWRNNK